jgi:hypothetical protein
VVLYWSGSYPLLNNMWNRCNTRSFITDYSSFYIIAGSLSYLGAFYVLASITFSFTSFIIRFGMATSLRHGYGSLSSMSASNGGKKMLSSSSAYLTLSCIIILSTLFSGSTLLLFVSSLGLRYLMACQMLVLLARKLSQYVFFCLLMAL